MSKISKTLQSARFWIVTFLLILIACLCVIFINKNADGSVAEVYVEDEIVAEIPLCDDGEYPINTRFGTNILQIKDGKVRVMSADCENQICVGDGWTDKPNKPLVCAPHHLVVVIADDENSVEEDV